MNNPLLYEGNYPGWRREMDLWLAAAGLPQIASSKTPPIGMTNYQFSARSWMAAKEIRSRVSPHLLERVPQRDQLDAYSLLTALRKLAQPLRFTDLPKDIRLCVYDHLEELQDRTEIVRVGYRLPAITQVSQQLRNETRSMVIQRTTFQFHIGLNYASREERFQPLRSLEAVLRPWFENVIRDDLDDLRCIRLLVPEVIETSFVQNQNAATQITVQNLSPSLVDEFLSPDRKSILRQQAREERLERMQIIAGWMSAQMDRSPDWKKEAMLEILRGDEDGWMAP